jgi:drug/metabolite transporter (DMT)-like permease
MTNQKKGLLLIFCTTLISGVSIFINGISVKMIEPGAFTFVKNGLVGLCLFALILGFKMWPKLRALTAKDWGYLVLIGLVGGSIPFLLFFNGLKIIGSAPAGFLQKTMFIYVGIMAIFFLKEKIPRRWLIFAAATLLAGNYLLAQTQLSSFGYGHVLVLAAAVFWAIENVIAKKLLEKMSGTVLAFGRMFFGSLFILTYLISQNGLSPVFSMTPVQWTWTLVATALLLGYVLTWYNGLKHVPVTTATIILLAATPITTLLNIVILQKSAGGYEIAGMLILLTAITIWVFANGRADSSLKSQPRGI